MRKTKYLDLPFFHYAGMIESMGFRQFYHDPRSDGRYDLGRYRCRGRMYYLNATSRPWDKDLWCSNIVMFYDPDPSDYPCVKTMIKAANHSALIKARQFVEMNKVFELCS